MPMGTPPRHMAMIMVGLKPSENTRSASRKESTNNWLAERYCLSLMASRTSLRRLELKGPLQTTSAGYYLVKAIY